jgi:hypothetical protein
LGHRGREHRAAGPACAGRGGWKDNSSIQQSWEGKFHTGGIANRFRNADPSNKWNQHTLDGSFKRNLGRLPDPPGGVPRPKKISPSVTAKFKKNQEKLERMFNNTKSARKIKLR